MQNTDTIIITRIEIRANAQTEAIKATVLQPTIVGLLLIGLHHGSGQDVESFTCTL
jgi:hypothetical protein